MIHPTEWALSIKMDFPVILFLMLVFIGNPVHFDVVSNIVP